MIFSLLATGETTVAVQGYEGAFLKMFLTLAILLVALFLAIWIVKRLARGRFNPFKTSHAIQLIERRVLSPKTTLYILQVDEQKILLSESQLEVQEIPLEIARK